MNTVSRRVKLLKLEGEAYSQSAIVQQLTQEFQCSKSTVYRDFNLRSKWQPSYQQMDHYMLKIVNRYEQIYQRASFIAITTKNDNVQVGALRIMMESMKAVQESLPNPILEDGTKPSIITVRWLNDADVINTS